MAIDPETRRPRIANVTAGLSGPAIKPIAWCGKRHRRCAFR
jgi:dihydroorotate dehydrogenase (NAD+) catalytic subunit